MVDYFCYSFFVFCFSIGLYSYVVMYFVMVDGDFLYVSFLKLSCVKVFRSCRECVFLTSPSLIIHSRQLLYSPLKRLITRVVITFASTEGRPLLGLPYFSRRGIIFIVRYE